MSERPEEAQRRQTFLRVMGLTLAGEGYCPGCGQKKEVFSKRRAGGQEKSAAWTAGGQNDELPVLAALRALSNTNSVCGCRQSAPCIFKLRQ